MTKLSDYVMQRIADHGVQHVFFVPGGGAMHLNESLGSNPKLGFVSHLHEQAASIAAEAYARVTGGMGVCMVTTGPGATNAITGLTGAWLDSTPSIYISGQVKRADIKEGTGLRQLGNQEIGIVEIVKSVTKYAVTITDPNSIAYHMDKAFFLAHEGRPGPIWLDIPLDVQAATIDVENLKRYTPRHSEIAATPDLKPLARDTLKLLMNAERPVLMLGNGIRVARAETLVEQLVDTLGIPVQTTWLGLDLIHDAHPLTADRAGGIAARGANFTLQNADFFLSIGARLDMATTGYTHKYFARAAKKVICDIDEAELKKLVMDITIPVIADAKAFIEALLAVAPEFKLPDWAAWKKRIAGWHTKYPLTAPESSQNKAELSMYDFAMALSDALPENAIIAPGSSGFTVEIFLLMLKTKKGQRCFHNRGTGAMGFAVSSAIGACVASGGKQVVSVDGDGGFQFNIQELATIATNQFPIKIFVANNNGYASIRSSQNGYFQHLVGCDSTSGLKLPPLEKLVPAYGLAYEKITAADDLRAKIASVLAAPGPMVCEVVTQPDEAREPRLSSYKREDGSMVSKPMEDLFPFLPRDEFLANMIIPPVSEE